MTELQVLPCIENNVQLAAPPPLLQSECKYNNWRSGGDQINLPPPSTFVTFPRELKTKCLHPKQWKVNSVKRLFQHIDIWYYKLTSVIKCVYLLSCCEENDSVERCVVWGGRQGTKVLLFLHNNVHHVSSGIFFSVKMVFKCWKTAVIIKLMVQHRFLHN